MVVQVLSPSFLVCNNWILLKQTKDRFVSSWFYAQLDRYVHAPRKWLRPTVLQVFCKTRVRVGEKLWTIHCNSIFFIVIALQYRTDLLHGTMGHSARDPPLWWYNCNEILLEHIFCLYLYKIILRTLGEDLILLIFVVFTNFYLAG